ncbi:MAG TPA: multicopper oxidase domain-containing protein, partial [Chitinophagaceae bacterium]|nr:multicopper oxidase domain-containing protein [Chitinophagaceae bacterium]
AGLAGYYLITDENEMNLQASNNLPAAPYDLGLAIQDRMFTTSGQLFYPSMPENENDPDPSTLPEMFGDFILVNGMTWPVLDVEPRQYRFRVLNGSDSRFYNVFLSTGQQFIQVGSDQGLLPSPVTMNQMLIAPGERKDIVIDFSSPALWGQTILVKNNAKAPYPKGDTPDPQTTGGIMAFRVIKPLDGNYSLTSLPTTLRPAITPLQTTLAPRKLILFEAEDEYDRIMPMLGTVEEGAKAFRAPLTENPMLNSTEIWEIYNETVDPHPIHLHLVRMQLISRQRFHANVDEATGKPTDIRLIGRPRYPGADEQGWKDTWVMYPGEVTRVIATFDRPGSYVWHCHILSHEEHDMMRPFYVGSLPADFTRTKSIWPGVSELETSLQLRLVPNPFNNYFTVQFKLTHAENVDIKLFDDNGALLKQVYNGLELAGLHTYLVNANQFAQGIYFCEITMNGQRVVRKVVLQR